jgi:hypothetical protein
MLTHQHHGKAGCAPAPGPMGLDRPPDLLVHLLGHLASVNQACGHVVRFPGSCIGLRILACGLGRDKESGPGCVDAGSGRRV